MSGVFGTKEWSNHSVNCVTGCSHNCRYCYARAMAVRFGRCEPGEWGYPKVRRSEVVKPRPASATEPIKREDLCLICFDYVCS